MAVINFEEAKARLSRDKSARILQDTSDGVEELRREYREMAEFFNRWYDEHVVGEDENGRWVYKNL